MKSKFPTLQIAAQNSRKRKYEQVNILETELLEARRNKERVLCRRSKLLQKREELRSKVNRLETVILTQLGYHKGRLQLDENENLYLTN